MFFLRVKAIYFDSKAVVAFFALLWLSTAGCIFLWLFSLMVGHIGTTQRCITIRVNHLVVAPLLMHSAYDTLVFIAISLRITSMAFSTSTKSLFRRDGLPHLSKSLLLGGQLYYLFVVLYLLIGLSTDVSQLSATIPLSITLVVLNLAPVSLAYKLLFVMPHLVLDSLMACRVFRGLKLGLIEDVNCSMPSRSIHFVQNHTTGGDLDTHGLGPRKSQGFRHGSVLQVELTSKGKLSSHEDDSARSKFSDNVV
jgi:hypothetical protein